MKHWDTSSPLPTRDLSVTVQIKYWDPPSPHTHLPSGMVSTSLSTRVKLKMSSKLNQPISQSFFGTSRPSLLLAEDSTEDGITFKHRGGLMMIKNDSYNYDDSSNSNNNDDDGDVKNIMNNNCNNNDDDDDNNNSSSSSNNNNNSSVITRRYSRVHNLLTVWQKLLQHACSHKNSVTQKTWRSQVA